MVELRYAETRLVCSSRSDCRDGTCAKTIWKNSEGEGVDATWRASLLHPNTWNQAKTRHKI